MRTVTTFEFADEADDGAGDSLRVQIAEEASPEYGLYVWPCARVLAQHVWRHRREFQGKRVLEVGAGVGLPGITAALVGAHVTLADKHTEDTVFSNLQHSLRLNGVSCQLARLTWGRLDMIPRDQFDLFLASDVLYSAADFEPVLATLRALLDCCCVGQERGRVFLTYQPRSTHASLQYLMAKWGLLCLSLEDGASVLQSEAQLQTSVVLAEIGLVPDTGDSD